MTSFSLNLENLMNKRNMNDSELADLVDVNRTTVTRWRKGVRSPKLEKLPEIAEVFGVTPLDLISEISINDILYNINETSSQLTPPRQQNVLTYAEKQLEEQNKVTSLDEYRKKVTVKRIHAAAAGLTGEELFDDLLEEEIEFYEDEVPNGTDFCVLVNGDSMEPAIREGTYAFFKEVHEINDGGIALVTLDGAGFIKRVDKYYDHIELISINPKYDSITVSSYNQFKVIGKLVM